MGAKRKNCEIVKKKKKKKMKKEKTMVKPYRSK